MENKDFSKKRKQFLQNKNRNVPLKCNVYNFINEMIELLFPILSVNEIRDKEKDISEIMRSLSGILYSYECGPIDKDLTVYRFGKKVTEIYDMLIADANAIYAGDPAARSLEEVIVCYPGFYSILVFRIAHELDKLALPVVPRMLTEYSHSKTGIDIHPKARIGESFCIDHGTGIVIGETTIIGNSVKIYQGVTLGALSVDKKDAGEKRHPTIEDNVVIYSGSTILGGETSIGHDSVIGGNVWLTHSVYPHSIVVNRSEVHLKNNNSDNKSIIDFVI